MYLNQALRNCQGDAKKLFHTVNKLLKPPQARVLPTDVEPTKLANAFLKFFEDKVLLVRSGLPSGCPGPPPARIAFLDDGSFLDSFKSIEPTELESIVRDSRSTTSFSDPIPTWLLKLCLPTLVRLLTEIINLSITTASVPEPLKLSVITPLLKKASLPSNVLSNYRPISTLPFLSKVLERAVIRQLTDFLKAENMYDEFQSAYRPCHSTETAVIKVQNDLLRILDDGSFAVLVLLDLSAAFDTVDHSVLLQTLSERARIRGRALAWIKSYLSGRSQNVRAAEHSSKTTSVRFGVPQGSVLGPALFAVYLLPLGDLLKDLKVSYHLYADDTQVYIASKPSDLNTSLLQVQQAVSAISGWMSQHFMMLNPSKTEFMVLSSRYSSSPPCRSLKLPGGVEVSPAESLRDLGAIISADLLMDKQIGSLCKSISCQLRNVSRIRSFLTRSSTISIIRALVISRLDYHNGLLVGAPHYQVRRLQVLQNFAARLVFRCSRYSEAMPLLRALHWLPVECRVLFKICLLAFRSLHGTAPTYLCSLLVPYKPPRSLRSSIAPTFVVPKTRTKTYGDRAFSVAAPRAWNSLPASIRQLPQEKLFRKALKTHIFMSIFN